MSKQDNVKKLIETINKLFGEQKTKEGDSKQNNSLFRLISAALIVVLIGLALNIVGDMFNRNNTKAVMAKFEETNDNQVKEETDENLGEIDEYRMNLKKELISFLEKMQGVGKVDLMIYLESGKEHVPAINVNDSKSITDETDTSGGTRKISNDNDGRTIVVLNNGDETKPLITKTYEPKISGITIIAEGAQENLVKLRITEAIMTLFDLDKDQVQVYPMK